MRWLPRSATNRRPRESNASACGVRNSPGAEPILPHSLMYFPSFVNFTMRPFAFGGRVVVLAAVAVGHEDVAVRRRDDIVGSLNVSGPLPATPGLAERHQDLALGAELERP